jgi:hypothetical protein
MSIKHKFGVGVVIILTLSNVTAAAFGIQKNHKSTNQIQKNVTAATAIKSSKLVKADITKTGIQNGQGKYDFESTTTSKQTTGAAGRLTLLTSPNGINFISAIEKDNILDGKLSPGWTTKDLAVDRVWEPGGCASKPTYLLQSKYVFIDDGKNQPTDKYNSYIIYDITSGQYRYFGGDKFTDQQGQREKIMKVADENDQPVFYIDVADTEGGLVTENTLVHNKGYEAGYIIRRVVNPADLTYKDYKLPYTLPGKVKSYSTDYYGTGPVFTEYDSKVQYQGTIANNRISVASLAVDQLDAPSPVTQTELEKQLSSPLALKLPDFIKAADGSNPPKDNFSITPLGSTGQLQMFITNATSSSFFTPTIYDASTDSLDVATTQPFLDYSNFVALGVY